MVCQDGSGFEPTDIYAGRLLVKLCIEVCVCFYRSPDPSKSVLIYVVYGLRWEQHTPRTLLLPACKPSTDDSPGDTIYTYNSCTAPPVGSTLHVKPIPQGNHMPGCSAPNAHAVAFAK
jgi:hypothetical protein